MSFFQTILNSIYGPDFYKNLAKTTLASAFGYYFLLSLLLTIFSTLALTLPVSAGVKEITEKMVPQLINKYPQDLSVSIKNGKVDTTVKQPYMIKLQSTNPGDPKNLLVIDTKTPFSDDTFKKYQTIAVLTKDHFYYRDEQKHEVRGVELAGIDNVTISKSVIQKGMDAITPYFGMITPFILFFMFFIIYIGYTFGLVKVLFIALILFLLCKAIKPLMPYTEALKATLFGITAGYILEIIITAATAALHFTGIPFLTTLITLGIIIFNLKTEAK